MRRIESLGLGYIPGFVRNRLCWAWVCGEDNAEAQTPPTREVQCCSLYEIYICKKYSRNSQTIWRNDVTNLQSCTVRVPSYNSFFDLILKSEKWKNCTFFVFHLFKQNEKSRIRLHFFVFTFWDRKRINNLNIRSLHVGWNETPLSADWSTKHYNIIIALKNIIRVLPFYGFLTCLFILHFISFTSSNRAGFLDNDWS